MQRWQNVYALAFYVHFPPSAASCMIYYWHQLLSTGDDDGVACFPKSNISLRCTNISFSEQPVSRGRREKVVWMGDGSTLRNEATTRAGALKLILSKAVAGAPAAGNDGAIINNFCGIVSVRYSLIVTSHVWFSRCTNSEWCTFSHCWHWYNCVLFFYFVVFYVRYIF